MGWRQVVQGFSSYFTKFDDSSKWSAPKMSKNFDESFNEENLFSTCFQPISPYHFEYPKFNFRVPEYDTACKSNVSSIGIFRPTYLCLASWFLSCGRMSLYPPFLFCIFFSFASFFLCGFFSFFSFASVFLLHLFFIPIFFLHTGQSQIDQTLVHLIQRVLFH